MLDMTRPKVDNKVEDTKHDKTKVKFPLPSSLFYFIPHSANIHRQRQDNQDQDHPNQAPHQNQDQDQDQDLLRTLAMYYGGSTVVQFVLQKKGSSLPRPFWGYKVDETIVGHCSNV